MTKKYNFDISVLTELIQLMLKGRIMRRIGFKMKEKKIFVLLPAICAAMGLTACANVPEGLNEIIVEESEAESKQSENTDAEVATDVVSDEEGTPIGEDEIQKFTDYFNEDENNGFVRNIYESPEKLDWEDAVRGTCIEKDVEDGSEEAKAYAYASKNTCLAEYEQFGTFGVSKADFDKFVSDHAGIGADSINIVNLTYVKEYDKYYYQQSESPFIGYKCVSGTKAGDVYKLVFERDSEYAGVLAAPVRLTLKESEGKYLVVSNEYLWNERYETESKFDVDIKQFKGKGEIASYIDKSNNERYVVLTEGGDVRDVISFEEGDVKLLEVDVVDYDADGNTEIIVRGQTDAGEKIWLLDGMYYGYSFGCDDAFDNTDLLDAKSGIAGVKEKLLAENKDGKFDTYNKAYTQVAYLNNLSARNGCSFDLIYIDEDDVPELLVQKDGEFSLYTYKDGKASKLSWGGNGAYSKKNNVVKGTDFARPFYSAIVDYEIYTDICYTYEFNEETGEYEASPSKLFSKYVDDGDTTKEGVDKNVKQLEALEYEEFIGKMTYQDLKAELLK